MIFLIRKQPLKAPEPIDIMAFGIINSPATLELIEERELHPLKALSPMVSTEELIVNLLKETQPLNNEAGIIEIFGKLYDFII